MIDPLTRRLLNNAGGHGPLILMYHGTPPGSGKPVSEYSLNANKLAAQLDLLQQFGWQTRCIRDLDGDTPLPDRCVMLTFDDCFEDNLDGAFKPLLDRNMCATWYAVSNQLGQQAGWMQGPTAELRIMSPEHLREMRGQGMEIGSHTCNHVDLANIEPDKARKEISSSRAQLQDLLGEDIQSFAYPFGRFTHQNVEMVKDAGYRLACSVRPGWIRPDTDRYLLRRVTVFAHDSLGSFARKLAFAANDTSWRATFAYARNRVRDRLR